MSVEPDERLMTGAAAARLTRGLATGAVRGRDALVEGDWGLDFFKETSDRPKLAA
jgi:hypothetical protein